MFSSKVSSSRVANTYLATDRLLILSACVLVGQVVEPLEVEANVQDGDVQGIKATGTRVSVLPRLVDKERYPNNKVTSVFLCVCPLIDDRLCHNSTL